MLARNPSRIDRRLPKDRRRPYHLARLTYRGAKLHSEKECRTKGEQRAGWVMVSTI